MSIAYPDIDWQYKGPWGVPAKVLKVVDGDTFHPVINRGWYDTHRPRKGLRVVAAGGAPWDAPDRKDDPLGREAARIRLMLLLPPGVEVFIESWGIDDFGRTLASVELPGGRDVAAVMTAYGHLKGRKWQGPLPDSLDLDRVTLPRSVFGCGNRDPHPTHRGCRGVVLMGGQ